MSSIKGRQVRWYDPLTGKQRTKTCSTPDAARRWAEKMDRQTRLYRDGDLDADQLQRAQTRVIQITELVERYTEDLHSRDVTEGHRRDLLGNLDRALTKIGAQDVRDLTKDRIRRYLKDILDRGNSAKSHNAYRSALSNFCSWLKDFDYIKLNPVVVRPKDERKDRRRTSRALTVAEADALLNAASGQRRALYLFRLRTGLRVREASRIHWSDIDLKKQVLNLREGLTKNRKPDLMPLTEDVCEALVTMQRDALKAGRHLGDRPFPAIPGRPTWARDLKRAGIEPLTEEGHANPKCLRKTFNSYLLHAKVDLLLATLLMRHTPPGGMELTLRVYGDQQALLQRKRLAIEQTAAWIGKQRLQRQAASS